MLYVCYAMDLIRLCARGVDVSKIIVVINFDMPQDADSYLHRVGRAGRFGTKGLAISFVSSKDDAVVLNDVQKRFVISIPVMPDQIDCSVYMTVAKQIIIKSLHFQQTSVIKKNKKKKNNNSQYLFIFGFSCR
eukprot:TRINITY_DN169600_c0_g1_i1.p1 TRINITY_DN169600_c0_g1~~TRINITY_DN169600_c0_g1_i1.p1  ORF type:complete len:133 (+),score=6.82 TRINITY_DN169600_c0_g1_i1:80-478(+)